MIDLPATTSLNQRIPKQAFYANLHLNPGERRALSAQVDSIIWRNKLSADTLNIAPGADVLELQVFELKLSEGVAECTLLDVIDSQLPYHLLFLLVKGEQAKASIAFKQATQGGGKNAFKVLARFDSPWLQEEALNLPLSGLNMDGLYEGWVKEIAGEGLLAKPGESMETALERMERRQILERQIVVLEKKVLNERQFNRKMELNHILSCRKLELSSLL